jgi:hypothetical protein
LLRRSGLLHRLRDLQALLQGQEGLLQEVLRGLPLHDLCSPRLLREGLPRPRLLREGLPGSRLLCGPGLLRESLRLREVLQAEVLQGEVLQAEVLLLPSGAGLPPRHVLLQGVLLREVLRLPDLRRPGLRWLRCLRLWRGCPGSGRGARQGGS